METNKSRVTATKALLSILGFSSTSAYLEYVVAKVSPNDTDCIEWQFSLNSYGYGVTYLKGKQMMAHRLAYELSHSKMIGHSVEVCHTCDNRKCYNPNHLFLGSKSTNMQDMADKGRMSVKSFKPLGQQTRNTVRDLYILGWNRKVIADMLAIDYSTVRDITADIDIEKIKELSDGITT